MTVDNVGCHQRQLHIVPAVCVLDEDARARSAMFPDLRGIAPIDFPTLIASVEKTGRLVVVQEAPRTASVSSEIVAELTERCFYSMRAPGVRVAGYHVPYPPARIEEDYRPSVDRVLNAVDRVMGFES